jgi:glycerol uptake facilitator-like aquaporin
VKDGASLTGRDRLFFQAISWLKTASMNNQQPPPLARILRDSVLELFLTFLMLFGVVTIVRWVIGPSPISRMIPEIQAELLIVGVAVAILIAGLIMSPPGRTTGGHMNPAISLAMWRFGVFPGVGVAPYIIAQLLGSVLGAGAGRMVWGSVVAEAPVAYAVLQPGPGWSTAALFSAETVSMALIVLVVGFCLSAPRLAPFVPWIVGGAIGIAIAVLGTSTGGSVNPARQFGPATLSGQTHFLWAYLLAPMVGALLAARLRETIQRHRDVLTHKLCGTNEDGSALSKNSGEAASYESRAKPQG